MARLSVQDLVIEYESNGYVVRPIDNLSFDADDGELVVLLGPSGSGKTTLLSCLGGILTPKSGRVILADIEVTSLDAKQLIDFRRNRIGIVFQAFNLVPSLTARENVAAPLLMAGVKRHEALRRADELLKTVNLTDRTHHKPSQLSGGQQQRVAVARALVHDPPVLLADEPTANLDYIQAESVVSLLRELRSKGRLIVVSTHDSRIVPIADRVISLVEDVPGDAGPPQRVEYSAGEVVFEQGDRGNLVYVIEEGEIAIERQLADGGEELLATLGTGQYFGELGALLGFPRSATARAVTDVSLMAYSARDFRRYADGHPMPAATPN